LFGESFRAFPMYICLVFSHMTYAMTFHVKHSCYVILFKNKADINLIFLKG